MAPDRIEHAKLKAACVVTFALQETFVRERIQGLEGRFVVRESTDRAS